MLSLSMRRGHQYVPASCTDSRSPCPALNALANHSYIPHDGRNVSVFQLVHAIRSVYHLSIFFAWLLALAGIVACGCCSLSLDLHQLARHGRIEHDGSLVHDDAQPGAKYAPVSVNYDLLNQLLNCSQDPNWITFYDLMKAREKRNESLPHPLSSFHSLMAKGECALAACTFQDSDGKMPKSYFFQWFGEERLPEDWFGPPNIVGFLKTYLLSRKVASTLAKIDEKWD